MDLLSQPSQTSQPPQTMRRIWDANTIKAELHGTVAAALSVAFVLGLQPRSLPGRPS